MTENLASATPSDLHVRASRIDRQIADLEREAVAIESRIASTASSLRHSLRLPRVRYSDLGETIAAAEARLAEGGLDPWGEQILSRGLASLIEGRAKILALGSEAARLNEAWEEEGWSRFFLVPGGHIHSSRACSTCRVTTRFGWLPDVSGLTEAEAVAAHGPNLCSVCFPSAPVAWTLGAEKPAGCAGSGTYPSERGSRRYVPCPVCSETVSLTPTGLIRKHKPAA